MSLSVDLRPTPDQLRGISFFQSAGALTLQYLDTLLQRPVDEKIQFFSDLPNVLAELPSRVRTGLVLSSMQPEFANSKGRINSLDIFFILFSIFGIYFFGYFMLNLPISFAIFELAFIQ